MAQRALQQMRRVSNLVNRFVATRWGPAMPWYFVVEYPKSGGTWLGRMIADVLNLPFPQKSVFPIGHPAVLHSHWNHMPRLRGVAYLERDGRDIMVSAFFHRMRLMLTAPPKDQPRMRRELEKILGGPFDHTDARTHLPAFMEHLFRHPWGARMTWVEHVDQWHPAGGLPGVVYVSYEQLRTDPCQHLKRVVEALVDMPIEDWRIEMAVEKFSIERQTGRAAGQEDAKHFIRKGVVGDWANHFSPEAAAVFDRLAGETLVRLGYEPDRSWVEGAADGRVHDTEHPGDPAEVAIAQGDRS